MSDLPAFLTHNPRRRMAWRGHDAFPRKVIQVHERGEWGTYGPLALKDLRIFKKIEGSGVDDYFQMTPDEIDRYMENPENV